MKNHPNTKPPADLQKALAADPKAKALWRGLTPIARRDFISWITGAKQAETRKRRVRVACSKLLSGQRRPCCYAVVPMKLYKALGDSPKAKAKWSKLTSIEKRDFIDWINSAKKPEINKQRIQKICDQLSN